MRFCERLEFCAICFSVGLYARAPFIRLDTPLGSPVFSLRFSTRLADLSDEYPEREVLIILDGYIDSNTSRSPFFPFGVSSLCSRELLDTMSHGLGRFFHPLVTDGEQRAVAEFDSARVAEIATRAIAGNEQRLGPGAAVIGADAGLIAERRERPSDGHSVGSPASCAI